MFSLFLLCGLINNPDVLKVEYLSHSISIFIALLFLNRIPAIIHPRAEIYPLTVIFVHACTVYDLLLRF
jgi:hypothetical protein